MSLEGKSAEEIEALANLAMNLSSNPKTRLSFLGLTKQVNPEASIPEIDIPNNLRSALDAPLKQLDALTKKMEEREVKDRIEQQRRDLMSKGITADELPKLEKLMVDKGIGSHETALQYLRMEERMAEPTPATSGPRRATFDKPAIPNLKDFGGDMDSWSKNEAYKMIDELRGKRA
jgi:hypothetical protein